MTLQLPTETDPPMTAEAEPKSTSAVGPRLSTGAARRWVAGLSPRNIGAIYVLAIIIIAFSFWVPTTFPTVATLKQVLDSNAITAMAALALVVPLSARTFDLSFAYTMTLS